MMFATNSKEYYQFQIRDTSEEESSFKRAAITTYRLQNIAMFFLVPILVT